MVCQAPREAEPGLTSVQQGPAKPGLEEALIPDGSRCALHSLIDCGLDAGAGPCEGEGIGPGHELRQQMEDVNGQLAEMHVDAGDTGGHSGESACARAAHGGRVRRVIGVYRQ